MKRRLIYNDQGGVVVEFALVAPMLFLITFGLFEMARAYFIRSNMQYAADEAGRYAMVYATANNETIIDQVSQHIIMVDTDDVTITIQDQTVDGMAYKEISLSYSFSSVMASLAGLQNVPLSVRSNVPIMP